MGDLDGRVAVVTGGARGIGLGCCHALSAAGASVVIADIDTDQAEVSAKELPGPMATPLTMPVLGVGGRHNMGEMVAKALAAVAGDVTTAVVDGAGHWPSDENPGELSRVLLDFLA